MSLRDGIVQTNVTWSPHNSASTLQLNYTVLAHRKHLNLGVVRLDFTSSANGSYLVTDILDGAGAVRSNFNKKGGEQENMIWTSVKPVGIDNITAYEFSLVSFDSDDHSAASTGSFISHNESTIDQSWRVQMTANRPMTIYKYVGIASSDAFPGIEFETARKTALEASKMSWEALVNSHRQCWDELWDSADITIPGNRELQAITRASLYHLLANLRPGNEGPGLGDNSISPSGLTSDVSTHASRNMLDIEDLLFGLNSLTAVMSSGTRKSGLLPHSSHSILNSP